MRKLSIKMKVTIWYTGLVTIILGLVFSFLWLSSDKILQFNMEHQIKKTVEESVEEIDDHQGSIDLDDDFEHHDDGVTLLVYSANGEHLAGYSPYSFDTSLPFLSGEIQTVLSNSKEWLVYDLNYETENGQSIWVRGIMLVDRMSEAMNAILLVTLISFPFLILIAAFGGYFITKRAFRPMQKIINSVGAIREGKDLTKRIHLKGPKDEVHALADTFDSMFDRLQSSFESEKQFTSDASHELRTPTSVIISQAEYAMSQKDNPEETAEALNVILKQSKKMTSLISQLLLLARTDQKNNHLVFEQINISELAEIVADELTLMAESADIEMKTDIEPNLIIEADQTLMMRLLMNLISNAITYGKQGGFVKVHLHSDGDTIVGTISDNGIGIQKQHLPKIWDRFYRVDPSRTATASGNTGLGLAIVKWIVETHHGTITAESEYGKGSTFTFCLPQNRT